MATSSPHTTLQCCEIFLSGNVFPSPESSVLLLKSMEQAIHHVWRVCQSVEVEPAYCSSERVYVYVGRYDYDDNDDCDGDESKYVRRVPTNPHPVNVLDDRLSWSRAPPDFRILHHESNEKVQTQRNALSKAATQMEMFLDGSRTSLKCVQPQSLCGINLEAVYPSSDVKDKTKVNSGCNKAPMSLLIEGRKDLNRFSDEMSAEQEYKGEESSVSNANSEMLKVLNCLRQNFETCSALLGAFMEAQVQLPLESRGNRYVNTIAKHANFFGLGVWGLLILPFRDVKNLLDRLPGSCQRLVVDLTSSIYALHEWVMTKKRHLTNYDGKLEFLLTSMKKSSTSNREFVSYSLERQLVKQCENRNITDKTSLDDILKQWQANFEEETLTLVPDRYRPLVARWIKWSLMINRLRESIAEQTAVGVIGLVNSGKSKFVRSIFGIETITGTTAQKRTTVPFIYNLEHEIKGMDVIDFPGVDDQDKTIPELAELLLSLTRVVVFVVDYKRAHTQSTKDWLDILEKEKVPVLICLSFADKLYAELMGEGGNRDSKEIKADIDKQLEEIKEQIGQPEIGHRDFKFTVFSFDNDSKLNTEESKQQLRQAGLSDELDVGRWIAEKLQDYKQNDLSQRLFSFIEAKKRSTLDSNKSSHRKRGRSTKNSTGPIPEKQRDMKEQPDENKPTCSKFL